VSIVTEAIFASMLSFIKTIWNFTGYRATRKTNRPKTSPLTTKLSQK